MSPIRETELPPCPCLQEYMAARGVPRPLDSVEKRDRIMPKDRVELERFVY